MALNNLFTVFTGRIQDWLLALMQHVQISLSALLAAIFISIPLGILLSRKKSYAETVLQITGIIQTIPSLAILGLMIPFLGIGTLPALTALIIYALFPILQNTITGLSEIPPVLNEAAEALGMNRWEKLKNYELALAMPVITSGIRTASVMIIGTATLAALRIARDYFQLRHPYIGACLIKKVFSCTMFLYIGSHAFFRLFFPPA